MPTKYTKHLTNPNDHFMFCKPSTQQSLSSSASLDSVLLELEQSRITQSRVPTLFSQIHTSHGAALVANKNIDSGTLLLSEEADALIIRKHMSTEYCHACVEKIERKGKCMGLGKRRRYDSLV